MKRPSDRRGAAQLAGRLNGSQYISSSPSFSLLRGGGRAGWCAQLLPREFQSQQLGMLLKLSAKLSYCVSGGSPVTRSFWLRREVSSSSDADYYIRSLQHRGWRPSPRTASSRPPAPLLRPCCDCGCDLTKEAFATRQWARPTRVCLTCTRSSIASQRVRKEASSVAAVTFVPPAPHPSESFTADSQPESAHFRPATVPMAARDPSCDTFLAAAGEPPWSGTSLLPGAHLSTAFCSAPSSSAHQAVSAFSISRASASSQAHPPTRERHVTQRPTPLMQQRALQRGGLGASGGAHV